MNTNYQIIDTSSLDMNFFKSIGKDWMLLSAVDISDKNSVNYNGMTASWGGIGVMWNKNIFWCVVRPQRYTNEFIEKSDKICVSFFDEKYKNALKICGSTSGRDGNKLKEAGLTPFLNRNQIDFEEAKLTIIGKKIYTSKVNPDGFVNPDMNTEFYSNNDHHILYVCEIDEIRKHI